MQEYSRQLAAISEVKNLAEAAALEAFFVLFALR
jgi:hypothetical protein